MKTKILVELFGLTDMIQCRSLRVYVGPCVRPFRGRRGDQRYLGKRDTFDKAIATFSAAYADQSEKDHAILMKAVRSGDLEVETEPD